MTSAAVLESGETVARRRVPSSWVTRQPRVSGEQLPLNVDLSPSRLGALILCAAGLFVLGSSWEFVDDIAQAQDPILFVVASVAASVAGLRRHDETRKEYTPHS